MITRDAQPLFPADMRALLTGIGRLAVAAGDGSGVIDQLLSLLGEHLEAAVVFVSAVDSETLRLTHVCDRAERGVHPGDCYPSAHTYCATLLAQSLPALRVPDARGDDASLHSTYAAALGIGAYHGVPLGRRSGTLGVVHACARQPGDGEELALQMAAAIITQAQTSETKLQVQHQAHFDQLTGLPNRVLLRQRIEEALVRADHQHHTLALLVVDIDSLRVINETFSHAEGDRLLQHCAERLQEEAPPHAVLARMGGDDFVVLLEQTDRMAALAVSRSLAAALEKPLELAGQSLQVQINIGIVLSPEHGILTDALLRQADVATFQAKRTPQHIAVYRSEQDPFTPSRLALVEDLRSAIRDGGLTLHYQPQLDLAGDVVIGVEALARWTHPTHGVIAPDRFIPLAEQNGLIGVLTQWVLEEAVRQLGSWLAQSREMTMAINISALNLREDTLPAAIEQCLERHDVPAYWLKLEITESGLMADPERAEQAHRVSEAHFREIFDHAPLGMLLVEPSGQVRYANTELCKILGYDLGHLQLLDLQSLAHPDDRDEMRQAMLTLVSGERDRWQREQRYLCRDGSPLWVFVTTRLKRGTDGRPSYFITLVKDISERRQAELDLRLSEERFRVLIEHAPDAILVYDVDQQRFLDANRKAEQLFDCTREELFSAGPLRFYPAKQPDGRPVLETLAEHTAAALAGEQVLVERTIVSAAGVIRECEVQAVRLPAHGRRLLRVSYNEVTERKRESAAARTMQLRYWHMFEANPAVKLVVEQPSGRILDANSAACAFYQYTRDQLTALHIWEINTQGREETLQDMAVATRGRHRPFQFRHRLASGEVRDVEVYTSPVTTGERVELYSIVIDVTDRRRADQRLQASERRYRALFDYAPAAILTYDALLARFVDANTVAVDLFECERGALLDSPPSRFFSCPQPDGSPAQLTDTEYLDRALRGESLQLERVVRTARQRERVCDFHITYVPDDQSELLRFTLLDITARKQTEATLAVLETRYRAVVEAAPDAILTCDAAGQITLINSQAERLFGYEHDELLGQAIEVLLPAAVHAQHAQHRAGYTADPHIRPMGTGLSLHARTKDGREVPVEISLSPLDDAGEPMVIAVIRDISAKAPRSGAAPINPLGEKRRPPKH